VVHDAVRFAGPGAEVSAVLHEELFSVLAAPVARVGARFVPNPAARELEAQVCPSADRIVEAVRGTMGYKQAGA
jgi:pyruvate dehydrogenase E1 component beta subunit